MISEESFGLFIVCWHEGSQKEVDNGCQQDHQEDNLSLVGGGEDGCNYKSYIFLLFQICLKLVLILMSEN